MKHGPDTNPGQTGSLDLRSMDNLDPGPGEIPEWMVRGLKALPGIDSGRDICRCAGFLVSEGHRGENGKPGHRWWYPVNQCDRAGCVNPICIARHGRKRADRVRKQFAALRSHVAKHLDTEGSKLRLLCVVLTVPDSCMPTEKQPLQKLRMESRAVLSNWILKANGLTAGKARNPEWKIGGVDVYHPAGDPTYDCPDCGWSSTRKLRQCKTCGSALKEVQSKKWRPHIHTEIPAYAVHAQVGDWRKLRCKMHPAELDELREDWGRVLVSVCGWKPGGGDSSKCSVHYRWISEAPKVAHRIRYDMRHFPLWHGQWRSVRWWGFLTPRWRCKLGLAKPDPDEVERDEFDRRICPCCGKPSQLFAPIPIGDDPKNYLDWGQAPPWLARSETVYS